MRPAVRGLPAGHGVGSHEGDLIGLAPYLPQNVVLASLRAPLPHGDGFSWYPLSTPGAPSAGAVDDAAEAVLTWLDSLGDAHPTVSLLGFSQGGSLSLQLLRHAPRRFEFAAVLAGFVESGESLEQAIHREVGEEVDIDLGELTYFGSQPWPFPRSLMVGFFARARSTRICVDVNEIAHAEWHTRDGLQAKLANGELGLPGPSSIAYRLVQTWLEGPTPLPAS